MIVRNYKKKNHVSFRYCSLAQFVEGNDIARRSFKRHSRPASTKLSKTEANVNRQSTLTEESESSLKGSKTSLNKIEKELSNLEDARLKFPQVSVIVEPPSPDMNEQIRAARAESLADVDFGEELRAEHLSTSAEHSVSNNSSNSNLLGFEPDSQFLTASPGRTRRISCCSMLNPNEAAALAAAAATTKFYEELDKSERKEEKENAKRSRKLPIINPLVRLPTWPSKNYFTLLFPMLAYAPIEELGSFVCIKASLWRRFLSILAILVVRAQC